MTPKDVLDKMIYHQKNHQEMVNKKGEKNMRTKKVTREAPKIVMNL